MKKESWEWKGSQPGVVFDRRKRFLGKIFSFFFPASEAPAHLLGSMEEVVQSLGVAAKQEGKNLGGENLQGRDPQPRQGRGEGL